MSDPVARSKQLDKVLKEGGYAGPIEDLFRYGRRNRNLIRLLVVAVALNIALVIFAVVVGVTVYQNRVDVQATRRAVAAGCHARNTADKTIRDIIDHSATSASYDLSKLTPDEKKLLTDVAAAQIPPTDPKSFRAYVYDHTPILHCPKA